MRNTINVVVLVSVLSVLAQARTNNFVNVSFTVDGKPSPCDGFQVQLQMDGKSFIPKVSGERFEVPEKFREHRKSWNIDERVDISLTCNGLTLVFPHQHPGFLTDADWRLGVAYPLYAAKEYGYTHEFDRGAWMGYLIFEGEPGVVTFSAQDNVPSEVSAAMQREQAAASAERRRDIAYVLAVFRVQYQNNRDYLLSLLHSCLARPKQSPEDDLCNDDLVKFITNLYWRGDSELLAPLVQVAETRRDVIDEIGNFYADLLARKGDEMLDAMSQLPDEKQQLVCKLAYEDDLSMDAPRRKRVMAFLLKVSTAPASRCLAALREAQ